ncbi:hypothetical protein ZEAMMB73_Zm00001d005564 [Zea mays]|uniref:Uncharacterized protein n=1 Tax=Zea mays TaxID=4577 RepID=A0A1D6ENU9_MAIZE|nr:hypothetical protein ZEAMMB73_Zm00001d005564 [Zea mays]
MFQPHSPVHYFRLRVHHHTLIPIICINIHRLHMVNLQLPKPEFKPHSRYVFAPLSVGSENQAEENPVPKEKRPKRLEWTKEDEEKLVNAWFMHSNDPISGNNKSGSSFWGQIAATYNSTSDPIRHRTAKQLKDHWVT